MSKNTELDKLIQKIKEDTALREAVKKLSSDELNEFGAALERDGFSAVEMFVNDKMGRMPDKAGAYKILIPYLKEADALPYRRSICGFVIKKLEAIVKHSTEEVNSNGETMDENQN